MAKHYLNKPKTIEAQIDQIWTEVFNHIPSQFRWMDMKLNFVLGFMALVVGLLAVVIARLP